MFIILINLFVYLCITENTIFKPISYLHSNILSKHTKEKLYDRNIKFEILYDWILGIV